MVFAISCLTSGVTICKKFWNAVGETCNRRVSFVALTVALTGIFSINANSPKKLSSEVDEIVTTLA